jgi:sulfide:quinone oxidoreductase
MRRIVILGAGFAGLTAIRQLRKAGCRDSITLVSPQPILHFYPSLIWVPAGLRSEADLNIPLDNFLARHQVHFHQGHVTGLSPDQQHVHTDTGDLSYDQLLIATGGRFIKKLPGIEHVYTPCEGYAPTKAYSDRLAELQSGTLAFGFASNPNEQTAMRGGPIFEFLFGIDTLLRQQGRRDRFKMVFFNPAAEPGKRLGEKAVKHLLAEMGKRGIETHLGHKMKGFSANSVMTEGGNISSDLTLFMPGMTGPVWAEKSGLPLSPGGFFKATEQCQVEGFATIFVAGDAGSYPGPDWLPKQAHIADLQAETAVKNMLATQRGQAADAVFKTELICIVDTLNSGMLVYRDSKRARLLPKLPIFHWLKRAFEWNYLRAYR